MRARSVSGFALLVTVIVLGLLGVAALAAHLIGSDRLRLAWALAESSGALYAAEAGLETGLAAWDSTLAGSLAPGAGIVLTAGRLGSGDRYVVGLTRVDDGSSGPGYYVVEARGRSHGAWRGRRELAMFVRVLPETVYIGGGTTGVSGSEIHSPHPLAQFRWLKILE